MNLKHIRWALTQATKRIQHHAYGHVDFRDANACQDCKEIKHIKEALATMTDEAINKLEKK